MQLERNQEAYARKMHKRVKGLLDDQLAEVISNLPGAENKEAVGVGLFDEQAANKAFQDAITALLYELAREQGEIAMAFAGEEKLKFELIAALRHKIDTRISLMAANYNAETIRQLKEVVEAAQVEGLSLQQLKKQVEEVYQPAKGYRAERISRTESIHAANEATIEGYRQVGYVTGKEWFTNPGACEFCRSLNGKIISLDKAFKEVGQTIEGDEGGTYSVDYDAIQGPPAHPNCTCTVIPYRGKL